MRGRVGRSDHSLGVEWELKPPTSINWRASLVPAAAVIPAPIAYIKVVAVKKLVVEFVMCPVGLCSLSDCAVIGPSCLGGICVALGCRAGDAHRLL